ncbi:MAG TPA: DUF2127 domain-containing protein [Verrucomicrobiae bacterium]|nr:DUF2127 domain-containing protein [Verrucomicrobiae bacterium]
MGTRRHHDVGFIVIGVFKLVKGALLLAFGLGALSLIHKDATEVIRHWAHVFQVDTDSKFVQYWLVEIGLVQKRDLPLVVTTSLFYSALLSTEGVGLLMEKVWAEYLTSIITASFIPIEIYALVRHTTVVRICLLLANALVVTYLVLRLGQRKRANALPAS